MNLENTYGKIRLFFNFVKNNSEKIGDIVPLHITYWKNQKLDNYSGGPFADRTGGLIMFESSDIEKTMKLTDKDPFIEHDIIDSKWVKEWIQE